MSDFTRRCEQRRSLAQRAAVALGRLPLRTAAQRAAAETARALADELARQSGRNPSIALTGVFNTGKSLLANQLVGLHGLLAVANVPTTGNVTVVHLRPDEDGQPEVEGDATVTFLTVAGAVRRAAAIAESLVTLVDSRRLGYDVSVLRTWPPLDPTDVGAAAWPALEEVARAIWQGGNFLLRSRIYELFALLRAVEAGRNILSTSIEPVPKRLSKDLLDEAIRIASVRLPEQPPRRHAELALPGGHALTAASLALVYPLVERVDIWVKMPRGVWDFGDQAIDVIDFPGLGTGSLRDEVLSGEDIGNACTVALVVPADKPRSEDVFALDAMLESARRRPGDRARSVIVIASRFDQLPLPSRPVRRVEDLLESSDCESFGELYEVARQLTRQEAPRWALTSGLAHAALSGARGWGETTRDDLTVAASRVARWRPVVQALGEAGQRATHLPGEVSAEVSVAVGQALAGVTEDGGIDRLRRQLAEHVTTVGPEVINAELDELQARLRERLSWLAHDLTPRDGAPLDTVLAEQLTELRRLLNGLILHYQGHLPELRTALGPHGGPDGAGGRYVPGRSQEQESVADAVRRQAALAVHTWDQWRVLRGKAAQDGTVRVTEPEPAPRSAAPPVPGSGPGFLPPILRRPTATPAPVTTDAFVADYRTSLDQVQRAGEQSLEAYLRRWADEGLREHLTGEGSLSDGWKAWRPVLEDGLRRLGLEQEEVTARLEYLDWLTNSALVPRVFTDLAASTVTVSDIDDDDGTPRGFPFDPHRALPWHPRVEAARTARQKAEPYLLDVQNVLRLRRDLVRAISQQVCRHLQFLAESTLVRCQELMQTMDDVVPSLDQVRRMAQAPAAGPAPGTAPGTGPVRPPGLSRDVADLLDLLDDPAWTGRGGDR